MFHQAVAELRRAGRRLDSLGWVPATAGNLSARIAPDAIAVTCSGVHKGCLQAADVMELGLDNRPRSAGRPSAEAALHTAVYRALPETGAVLHGHSVAATVLSRLWPEDTITLRGYELQKAFAGQTSHEPALPLHLFDNDQDIPRLAARIEPDLGHMPIGYLIRGHGLTVWADTVSVALHRLEAVEFLLACELQTWRVSR